MLVLVQHSHMRTNAGHAGDEDRGFPTFFGGCNPEDSK